MVPALAAASLALARRNFARANLDYVTNITLHKDGRTLDLVLQNASGSRRLDNVSVAHFRLLKGNAQVAFGGQP